MGGREVTRGRREKGEHEPGRPGSALSGRRLCEDFAPRNEDTRPSRERGANRPVRSPAESPTGYIGVACNGSIHNFSIEHLMAARPAFNIRLPHDVCVKERTEADGTTVWTVDAEVMEHRQDTATYTWSKDGKECLAEEKCSRCGEAVRESGAVKSQIVKEPSEKTDGIIRYTATFKNKALHEFLWDSFLKLSHTF